MIAMNMMRARYGRPFFYLWSARTISFSGDVLAQVALVVLAAEQRDAALAVSLLLVAQTLPWLLGSLAGIVADRTESRRMMVLCELGQALLIAAVALAAPPFPLLLALIAVMSVLATLFLPASQSALPALVQPEALGDANALLRLGANVSRVVGPALAGLLLATAVGVPVILLGDAVSFLLSAALLSRLPALPRADTIAKPLPAEGVIRSLRIGLRYIARHPIARAVTLGLFGATLFVSLDNVGLVFLTERTLRAGAQGYSLAMAGYGIGMVIAPLLLLRLSARLRPGAMLIAGIALMGLGTMLCGLAPSLVAAIALQCGVGIGNGFQNVTNDTLLQRSVSRELLGRVFGAVYSVPYGTTLITYAAGGVLLALTSPRIVFAIAGLGTIAVAPLVWVLLAHSEVIASPSQPQSA